MGPDRRREEEQCGSPGEYKDKIVDSECEALWEDGGRTGESLQSFMRQDYNYRMLW